MKVIFLDRDGTVISEPFDERVNKPEKIQLFPDSIEALKQLAAAGYAVILITNQAGISEGLIDEGEFWKINALILEKLAPSGVAVLKTYMCPHGPTDNCDCRKPRPGMLYQASKDFDLDLTKSWMIGDRQSDVLAGSAARMRTIGLKTTNPTAEFQGATFVAGNLLDAVRHIIAVPQ